MLHRQMVHGRGSRRWQHELRVDDHLDANVHHDVNAVLLLDRDLVVLVLLLDVLDPDRGVDRHVDEEHDEQHAQCADDGRGRRERILQQLVERPGAAYA